MAYAAAWFNLIKLVKLWMRDTLVAFMNQPWQALRAGQR